MSIPGVERQGRQDFLGKDNPQFFSAGGLSQEPVIVASALAQTTALPIKGQGGDEL